jgi:hypothetical protein
VSGAGPGGIGPGRRDDDELGRLISEGLSRGTGAPVDERCLLDGARRGAMRIRRRRAVAVRVVAALAVVLPVGVASVELILPEPTRSSGAASRQGSADDSADRAVSASPTGEGKRNVGSAGDSSEAAASPLTKGEPSAPSATDTGVPSPLIAVSTSSPRPGALSYGASGQAIIPDGALLTKRDLSPRPLVRTSDTGNLTEVPPPRPTDTCGVQLVGLPRAVGSREVVFGQRAGSPSQWSVSDVVRVFAADGSRKYLEEVERLGCVEPVAVLTGDAATVGRFRDSGGAHRWYGVVRVGRTVSEIKLTAPAATAPSRNEVEQLLRAMADRLTISGLAGAAETDPALR